MSLDNIAALYFQDNSKPYESAKKRIQDLKKDGIVKERPREQREPSHLFLTKKAFLTLQNENKLGEYPRLTWKSFEKRVRVSEGTVEHEMQVMDVKAALEPAINTLPGFKVGQFSTWPILYQFHAEYPRHWQHDKLTEKILKPDGYISIKTPKHIRDFFLEVDLSNEVERILGNKAVLYQEYYNSGEFAVRNGGVREEKEKFPFLVLFVVQSSERRNEAAAWLLKYTKVLTQVWLTTIKEITTDPLGDIWVRPTEYRDVVRGTAYDIDKHLKPHSPREAFIEQTIQKHRLLAIDP